MNIGGVFPQTANVSVTTMGLGLEAPAGHAETLRRFREDAGVAG